MVATVTTDMELASDGAVSLAAAGTGTELARDLVNCFLSRPNGNLTLEITSFRAIIASSARFREGVGPETLSLSLSSSIFGEEAGEGSRELTTE